MALVVPDVQLAFANLRNDPLGCGQRCICVVGAVPPGNARLHLGRLEVPVSDNGEHLVRPSLRTLAKRFTAIRLINALPGWVGHDLAVRWWRVGKDAPGAFVGEDTLAQNISLLRKAVGGASDSRSFALARASSCRTRSREMPNAAPSSFKVAGLLAR